MSNKNSPSTRASLSADANPMTPKLATKPPLIPRPVITAFEPLPPPASSDTVDTSCTNQLENQLSVCNQYVMATCRDLLNDPQSNIFSKKKVK